MSILVNDGPGDGPLNIGSAFAEEPNSMLIDAMKRLLADTITAYMHAHGFHWNVLGSDFSEYHALFETIYADLYESVDPTAENILKLGGEAPYCVGDIVSMRTISDVKSSREPAVMVTVLAQMIEALDTSMDVAFALATAADEQGIVNFLGERIDTIDKWAWQLRASLGQA